jgi:hypothetical protein
MGEPLYQVTGAELRRLEHYGRRLGRRPPGPWRAVGVDILGICAESRRNRHVPDIVAVVPCEPEPPDPADGWKGGGA